MQNVNGDTAKFVRGGHFLLTERPLADLPFMVSRMGFSVSLSSAHWISVILFVLCAVVLAILPVKSSTKPGFPLLLRSLLTTFVSFANDLALCGFYTWSAILALLAMLLFLRGLKTNETRRLQWFVFAVIAYLTSILTHEEFILIRRFCNCLPTVNRYAARL